MPGGGLYCLVAYGAQNILLSGNPDFTYFYKTYKKYSHFAEESVSFSMEGPQELSYDQPIQVRLKLQRIADLVRDVYMVVDLPPIYCKFIELPFMYQNSSAIRTSQYNFTWVNYIGCHMIQTIGFYIGGQKIQEMEGAYLISKAQCDLDAFSYNKWTKLVGHIPDVYNPASGKYGGGITGIGYPLVYNNNGYSNPPINVPANTNRPSINGRTLQIPIPFWFAESTFGALPLVSLQTQECEIRVTLQPINKLYQILDNNGYQVAPGYQYNQSVLESNPSNVYYTSVSEVSDLLINNFLTDIGTPVPLLNTWQLNPRIQLTYIYLTDEERNMFSSTPLQYLVRQVTAYHFDSITSRQYVLLDTHNPIERLIILPRRSDSLLYRNQTSNFSNWINPNKSPFWNTTNLSDSINIISSTGRQVLNGQYSIINTLTILGDGNPLQEEKPVSYYTDLVHWKYLKGNPDSEIIVYPFTVLSSSMQPNGSLNSSRIRNFQLDLNVFSLPNYSFYQYDISIYVESLNWVNITSGTGGLKYAL